METFAKDFFENYRKKEEIDLLANLGGKKRLPFFFIKTIFFLVFHAKNYDVIHIYDAVLSPLAPIIKIFSKAKVSFTVNGLDIVYINFGYQKFMPIFLKNADKIFAISSHTMEQCALRGIPREKITVIPVGLDFENITALSEEKKSAIISKFNIPIKSKKILVTVGRLVKRKGHSWFIEHVMKDLPSHYVYLIAGDGPERNIIMDIIRQAGLVERVHLLGRISDEEKDFLYQVADLFVMPNIQIANDQEGFGIVLLEAGKYGLPVVASNIEGIRDVVIDRKTGRLIEEKNAQEFIKAITTFDLERSSITAALSSSFSWEKVVEKYYDEFKKMHQDAIKSVA